MNEYSDFHSESIGGESTPHKDIPTPETEAFAHQIRGLGTGYYQAIEFARSLEQRIFIAQADCAAMRVTLEGMFEMCGNYFDEDGLVCAKDKEIWAQGLKALSSAAGKELLATMALKDETLKELIKDRERLDWLEQEVEHNPRITGFIIGKNLENKWFITQPHNGILAQKQDSLRQAIDAAIDKTKK